MGVAKLLMAVSIRLNRADIVVELVRSVAAVAVNIVFPTACTYKQMIYLWTILDIKRR